MRPFFIAAFGTELGFKERRVNKEQGDLSGVSLGVATPRSWQRGKLKVFRVSFG